MANDYRIALAYSNIQEKFGVPVVVSGVILDQDNFVELEKRDLPAKRTLQQRRYSLFHLQSAFNDISDYLTQYETDLFTTRNDFQKSVEDSYLKLLRILRKKHLLVVSGKISSISFRCLENPHNWKSSISFSGEFVEKVKTYSDEVKFCPSRHYDRLLETAKILATLEYERLRSFKGEYILDFVTREKSSLFQILKMTWNSPPIEEYSNYDVGYPAIVVRRPEDAPLDYLYLEPKMKASFIPIAKFCRGYQESKEIIRCKKSTDSNPFGQYILGSSNEQCQTCAKGQEYSRCLYTPPRCNGHDASCGQKDFAGNICCGLYALYVTRFSEDLKVGTAFLPNVVGRLLEQGAGSALVIYPIDGIFIAHILEKAVKKYLEERIELFTEFGVKQVYRESPPVNEKLRSFFSDWNRNDEFLWGKIDECLQEMVLKTDDCLVDFSHSSRKKCNFTANYILPPKKHYSKYIEQRPLFHPISGRIVGIRGSFLFLDSGQTIDLKQLHGYVVRGEVS